MVSNPLREDDPKSSLRSVGSGALFALRSVVELACDFKLTLRHSKQMHSSTELHKSADEKPSAAIDPVCGMTVDSDSAAGSYEYKGRTYYFCSTHCLHKFCEDPERFLN